LLDTFISLLLARTVLVATKVGVFEALAKEPLGATEVAQQCGTQPAATEKLLSALVGAGYLRVRAGRYELRRSARTWLLKDSPSSLREALLYKYGDLRYIDRIEESGRGDMVAHLHEEMPPQDGGLYQRAMRAGANLTAGEVIRRLPIPLSARELLDIGG